MRLLSLKTSKERDRPFVIVLISKTIDIKIACHTILPETSFKS